MNLRLSADWIITFKMLASQKRRLTGVLLFTLIAACGELLPFWLLYKAINMLLSDDGELSSRLFTLAAFMATALLFKYICYASAYFFSHQAAYSILADTRRDLILRLAKAPLPWLQRHSSGQLKQTVLQDVERIESFIAHHTVEGTAAFLCPLMTTVFLCWIDWRLALAALISLSIAALASLWTMRGMSKQYDNYVKQLSELDSATIEYIRNIAVMKVFRLDAQRFQLMHRCLNDYYALIRRMTKNVIGGWALFNCLLNTGILFILPVGILLYAYGHIELSSIVLAIVIGAGILRPLLKISHLNSEFREVMAGIRRIAPILTLDTSTLAEDKQPSVAPLLTLNNVSFAYQQYDILHNINFTLKPGGLTVLLGPSGAGKSALAQIIASLLTPQSGQVTLDDIPLSELSDTRRASLIGLATQEPFLFKGTIEENLKLGHPQARDDDIDIAVKTVQAKAFIAELPQGLNTEVNEQGVTLSGGERQRLSVARTLLATTPILILDEATSFADNLTQRAFYQDLRRYYPKKTVLAITHRSYGIEHADNILIMEQGRIVDSGSHQALLERNPFYQSMCRQQELAENWAINMPEGNT